MKERLRLLEVFESLLVIALQLVNPAHLFLHAGFTFCFLRLTKDLQRALVILQFLPGFTQQRVGVSDIAQRGCLEQAFATGVPD